MKNQILFTKRKKINADDSNINNRVKAMSFNAELMQFGFILDQQAFNALSNSSDKHISNLYSELIPYLKNIMGDNRNFKPFYKNFPQDVMNASDFELWLNATLHYLSRGTWEPDDLASANRKYKFENSTFTQISLGHDEDLLDIFKSIITSKGSITPEDKEIVRYFFSNYKKLPIPDNIPFKENLCMVASLCHEFGYHDVTIPVKTATDVLRIATHMSGGNISLPRLPQIPDNDKLFDRQWRRDYLLQAAKEKRKSFNFKKFRRSERRFILNMLDKCPNAKEDMKRHIGKWIRLGEILHPREFKTKYVNSYEAFNAIRNEKVRTFDSRVESIRKSGNLPLLLSTLSERPGEFGKRLDDLLRDNPSYKNTGEIISAFVSISPKISNNVLIQLLGHFNNRILKGKISQRTCFIKGSKIKKYIIEKKIPNISKSNLKYIIKSIVNSLRSKFSQLDLLGKVWINPLLYKSPVPFAMRGSNKALKSLVRGTRLPFGDYKVLRAYVHWFDEEGNRDLDLSALLLNSEKETVGRVNFSELRYDRAIYHSGDVRNRRGPCAEYIDVDIEKTLENEIHYVVIDVRNFQNGPLHEVPECVFGWMGRDFTESNKHFIPKTIQNSFQLSNDGTTCWAIAIDLANREIIWLDTESNGIVLNHLSKDANSISALFDLNKTRLTTGSLLAIHADARGKLVEHRDDADTIFDENLVYEYDEILSKYM